MLINKSIEFGTYPSKLKLAKVFQFIKVVMNLTSLVIDSLLLSLFNLIFEKIMYHGLKSFIERCNILHDSQYGFREKKVY